MKKTKILIPALGMMMLSTAAAVSGTMAWFTANRSVEVNANNFAVEAVDGSLTVAASQLVGTAVLSNNNQTISMATNHTLADASFNYRSDAEKLYTDVVDANDRISGYDDLGALSTATTNFADNTDMLNEWRVAGSETAYYAFAFKLTFTYTFKTDTRTLGLFFNGLTSGGSSVTNTTVTAGSGSDHTYKGFRMAFIGNADRFVWAPNRTAADVYDDPNDDPDALATVPVPYNTVTGTDANAITAIASADLILGGENIAQASNGNETTNKGYLGTLAKGEGTTGTSEVNVVVWYEGTDPAVINASSMDKVSSVLKFYVRAIQA